MKKIIGLLLAAMLMVGTFAACGTKPAEGPIAPEEETSWPRTITDASGYEVTLEAKPQRIAILHSMYLEYFFVLDTPPIASAGANIGTAMKAMEAFETLKPYIGTAEIIDLGSAREINLEAVLAAEPDVIVTFVGHGGLESIYDQLTQIAPVITMNYTASAENPVTWEEALMECAVVVGKEALAEEIVLQTQAKIDDARAKLEPYRDQTFIFVRSDGKGGIFALGYQLYPYYYNAETGFGLTAPDGYPAQWGVISLESLAEMNPDYIIFQDFLEDSQAAVDAQESSVWNSLKAVQNDNVVFLDVSLNTTSPLALQILAEDLVEIVAK